MSLSQKIKVGFAIALTILTVLGGFAYQANQLRMASSQWTTISETTVATLRGLLDALTEAASSSRNYAATGDENSLEFCDDALKRVDAKFSTLRQLVAGRQSYLQRLLTLQSEINRSLQIVREANKQKKTGSLDTSELAELTTQSSQALNRIGQVLQAMHNDEKALLWQCAEASEASQNRHTLIVICGGGLVIVFLLGAMIITGHHLSKVERVEKALRKAERRFDTVIENSTDGILLLDTTGKILLDTAASARILGVKPGALVGQNGFERMHPADKPRILKLLEHLIAHPSESLTDQFRYQHANGSWRWIEAAGTNRLAEPSIGAIILNYRDVTGRREAEEALRESEERFRSLSASSPLGIFLADTDGRCVYANPRFRALFHHSLGETIGKGWLQAVFKDDRASVEQALQTAIQKTQDFSHEFRLGGSNGATRWVHLHASPMLSDSHQLLGHVGTIEDVTDHRAAEQQLRLQAGALEAAANGIVITDRNGAILWVNSAFSRLTGYTAQEAIGHTPRLIKSGRQDAAFYTEMWETILAGRVWHGQIVNQRKDHTLYTEEMTITPVREAGGEISHFIAIKQDVTERQKLEEQFRQVQKMEAVGQLAGGVAHDFNNLLMAILGYSDIILGEPEVPGRIRESAEEVKSAAERAASLTRQLLAFSRRQVLAPQVISLNTIVIGIEKMLRRLIGEDIALITRLKEPLQSVKADPNQIEQVIMNLAINARDAMPDGGKLVLETTEVTLDEHCNLHSRDMQPGDYVVLMISDTGSGMSAEVQAHLFEPFFTTKQQGKGTGLGLATVYGIVKQSGGHIGVYSEVGFGTTFKVYLPVTKNGKSDTNKLKVKSHSYRGTETILLVEDDDGVRKLVRETLKGLGYTVLDAKDGAEAVERFAREPAAIHLMITDVIMPSLGGCASAQLMKPLRPGMKVLYMSGYTQERMTQHGLTSFAIPMLLKPFSADALGEKVRELLDAPAKPA